MIKALKNSKFTNDEIKYFSQTIEEQPSLRLILDRASFEMHHILDIGCGIGRLISDLSDAGIEYASAIGVDLNVRYLSFAKSYYMLGEFICGDAHYLPFKDNSFDVIIINDVLWGPDFAEIVTETVRTLKKKGKLFFDIGNLEFYKKFRFCMGPLKKYGITYTLDDVEYLLRKENCVILGRYTVSLRESSRSGTPFPYALNIILGQFLRKLPLKIHFVLSKLWFSVVVEAQKSPVQAVRTPKLFNGKKRMGDHTK